MQHVTRTAPNNFPLTVIQFKHILDVYHRDSDKSAVKQHPFFEDLAFNTVKNYRHAAKILREAADACFPLEYGGQTEQMSASHAQVIVDHIIAERGPGAARCAVASMGSILSYMILYTSVSTSTHNAFDYVKIPKGEMIGAWTKEQIEQHLSADTGGFVSLLVLLLYETGQRLSDVVDIGPDNIKRQPVERGAQGTGEFIRLTQKKTGKEIVIPVSTSLSLILGKEKQYLKYQYLKYSGRSGPFLGQCAVPCNENSIRYFYQKECRRLGIEPLCLHGLRKSAVIRMIEAGATVFEVMAVTGHKSVSSLKHYMDGYSQMDAARAAFEKAGMV